MGFGIKSRKYLLLIDGDAIGYICGKDTVEESYQATDSIINSILYQFRGEVKGYQMVLSEKPYFRTRIYPEYKGQRKQEVNPNVEIVKQYLRDKYFAISFPGLEADDIVMRIKKKIGEEGIIVSTDKDVIKGAEGYWLNYKKMEKGYTNEVETLYFLYKQILMGDTADNIKGCPLIGEVKATKILDQCVGDGTVYDREKVEDCYKTLVFEQYLKYYKEEDKAREMVELNTQLIRLITEDEEYMRLVGYIPTIPDYIKVEID